ncbi:MAG TPA: hypothetical protein VFF04_00485 [Candidatus Babeliales bacterium]|nr:hypothetical protein [Candidatus Babeliales bacterium]
MAWYEIPEIEVRYLYDIDGNVTGVLIKGKHFEQLAAKLEDLHNVELFAQLESKSRAEDE